MNNYYKGILVVFLFSFQFVIAQEKHFVIDHTIVIDSISIYIDKDNTEKKSAIGFIRKSEKKTNKEKFSIDTCFFSNHLSKDPQHAFQKRINIEKSESNVRKYYLVYDEDCFSNKLSKDSIPLEGYFKMLDDTKPSNPFIIEPNLYSREINHTGLDDNPKLKSIPVDPTSNSEGWFFQGLKNREWIYNSYSFARVEEHYKNGIRDGLYTVYNVKDSILYQTTFIKGSGVEKIYRNDGSLYHIKHFKNGNLDYSKLYQIYYNNNAIAFKTDYLKGIKTQYYKNGIIFKTLQIKIEEGEVFRDRLYRGYNKDGKLKEKRYYENNKVIYTIIYDNKERIEKIKTGNMVQYFKKDKLKNIKFDD